MRAACTKTLTFFQARDITQREALELQQRQIYTMAWPFLDSLQAVEQSRDFDFRAVRFQLILCILLGSDLPHFSCRTQSRVCCAHLWRGHEQHNLYIQAGLTGTALRLKPELGWAVAGPPQPKALGLLSIKSVSFQGSSLAQQSPEAPVKWSVQSQYK